MQMKSVQPGSCQLLPGLFANRASVNRDYLLRLDSTCLLQNFYLEAGVVMPGLQVVPDPERAKLHWGWEAPSCQLRGHFLGHWLSAASMLIAAGKDRPLEAKLLDVLDELERCQQLNGGEWAASIPEKYFENLARGQYVWSPQYTVHKTLMGLKDVYRLLHHEQALRILAGMAKWFDRWTMEMQKRSSDAIYGGEQAGMLEVWAEVYTLTGEETYRRIAERYAGQGLYDKLDRGEDGLTDDHANASIPLAHGAAMMWRMTGDEKWLQRLKAFWRSAVEKRGMLCTSGMNAGEFWIPPYKQGKYLSDRDQEFCTVYNMVRVAQYLLEETGEAVYADYIERALYNGFLAQQNAYTGMPTYFLPLIPGSKKRWGSETRDFWCCHGTMVQAQALYPYLIWLQDEETVTLSQYIPSKLETEINGKRMTLIQQVSMKNYNSQMLFDEHSAGSSSRWSLKISVSGEEGARCTLRLRKPAWTTGYTLCVNGTQITPQEESSWLLCSVKAGDEIAFALEAGLYTEALPDMPQLRAVLEGPIVLCTKADGAVTLQGDAAKPEDFISPVTEHTYETFIWRQSAWRTRHQTMDRELIPLYEVNDEPYTVYMRFDQQ